MMVVRRLRIVGNDGATCRNWRGRSSPCRAHIIMFEFHGVSGAGTSDHSSPRDPRCGSGPTCPLEGPPPSPHCATALPSPPSPSLFPPWLFLQCSGRGRPRLVWGRGAWGQTRIWECSIFARPLLFVSTVCKVGGIVETCDHWYHLNTPERQNN